MERRQFIQMGALAGLSTATGIGCASSGAARAGGAALAEMPGMDAFLAELDHSMAAIARGAPFREFLGAGATQGPHAHEALIKKSLRSLVMAGSFHDLPEQARQHPGMQARLAGSMAEMDEAVFGMTHVLSSLTPSERLRIQEVLHAEPERGARIAASLDRDAVSAGVAEARRLHLRALSADAMRRLEREPVTGLIDEHVGAVQRVAARHGYTEEMQRRIVARAVHASLLGMQAGPPGAAGPSPSPSPAASGSAAPAGVSPAPGGRPPYPYQRPYPPPPLWAPDYQQEPPKKSDPGNAALTVGAISLGLGLTIGGVGLAFTSVAYVVSPVLIVIGGVLLAAGLIILLIGLTIRAAGD